MPPFARGCRQFVSWAAHRGAFHRTGVLGVALLMACGSTSGAARPTGGGATSVPTPASTPTGGTIIVYTHSTGFRHGSIETAAAAFKDALAAAGFATEISADPARISTAGLKGVRGIVMISTTGKPFGDPGIEALAAFEAFVKGGGALIGVHAASSSQYDPTAAQVRMMGAKFVNHPGSVRPSTCYTEGTNASVAKLPASFEVRDEIYVFTAFNPANQIVLRCSAFAGDDRLPIAWTRTEGAGRIFYSALGHSNEDYGAESRIFRDHLMPGALWALGR